MCVQWRGIRGSRHSPAAEEGGGNLSLRYASVEDEDMPIREVSST